MFKIVALGLNGFIPTYGRQTMSFLLVDESDEVFLLDAGTGIASLTYPEFQNILTKKKRLNILLSHYHLDHVAGLAYLPAVWRNKPIKLYAPERPFVDVSAKSAIDKLLNPPLFSLSFDSFPAQTELISVNQSQIKIGNHDFFFCRLKHDGGSMGIKINQELAYITDTYVNDSYQIFINNVNVLLHEVWLTSKEAQDNPKEANRHSVLEDVTDMAKRCSVTQLMPIHLNPMWDARKVKKIIDTALHEFKNAILLQEGTFHNLNG